MARMNNPKDGKNPNATASATTHCIWVTLEATEVIELKRITIDSDADSAVTFFNEILCPRVKTAALQRNVATDILLEGSHHEHISG